MVDKPLLVASQLEVVVFFHKFGNFAVDRIKLAVGAAVSVGQKAFLFGGVVASVGVLVEMAFVVKAAQ